MGGSFELVPLRASLLLQAYPLVREAAPEVTLDQWRRYARALIRPPRGRQSGIVALRCENDYLRGLFSYRVVPDLVSGRTLVVDCLAVSTLFSPGEIADALLAEAERIARRHRCATLRAAFPTRAEEIEEVLARRGFDPCGSCRLKPLGPSGAGGKPRSVLSVV